MIKAIIFDIGGVIASDVEEPMYKAIAKKQKISFKEIWKTRKQNWELYGCARITENQYWKNMLSQTEIKGNIASLKKKALSYIVANKRILPIIRKLSKKYKLAILSDNSKEWGEGIVKKYRLKKYFDVIVISYQISVLKPHVKMYKTVLKKLKLKPKECLFIDNNQKNLTGAKKLSIKTILFENSKKLEKKLKHMELI